MKNIHKYFGVMVISAIIGFFGGFVISNGNQTYMNKSERKTHNSLGIPIISGVICAIVGLGVGYSLIQSDNRDKEIGINNFQVSKFKEGRSWTMMTFWVNPQTHNENKIVTQKNSQGELTTYFNQKPMINHAVKSAAQNVVYKNHVESRYLIFQKLRAGEIICI